MRIDLITCILDYHFAPEIRCYKNIKLGDITKEKDEITFEFFHTCREYGFVSGAMDCESFLWSYNGMPLEKEDVQTGLIIDGKPYIRGNLSCDAYYNMIQIAINNYKVEQILETI